MKLEKAIEILEDDINHPTAHFLLDLQEAQKLGIEALKAWKEFREGRWVTGCYLLPGETKE